MPSAADEAAEWRAQREAKKRSKPVDGVGAYERSTDGPTVGMPEGVTIALVGQDLEADELLFKQLGAEYFEKLELMRGSGVIGSDALRAIHESGAVDVKRQCGRAGARMSDILKVVTDYMTGVHKTVMEAANEQEAIFAGAVDSIVVNGPVRLHLMLGQIAMREIKAKMERNERGSDGSSAHAKAIKSGATDANAGEVAFWRDKVQEVEAATGKEVKDATDALKHRLEKVQVDNDRAQAKLERLVEVQEKKNLAAMKAYDMLVDELSRSESENLQEFQAKTEEKKKVKRLQMAVTASKVECEQLAMRNSVLDETLTATSDRLESMQKKAGAYWRTLIFTREKLTQCEFMLDFHRVYRKLPCLC